MTGRSYMVLGYNTNGFAHHAPADAISILREIGYQSLALTVEREILDPPDRSGVAEAVKRLRPLLGEGSLRVTIETGSRFLLDPRRKHQPTLLSADAGKRARRAEFLRACVELAAAIGAESVSLWSGAADETTSRPACMERLVHELRELLSLAEVHGVRLSFEPEPGMWIERMADFAELQARVAHPLFGLTLDVGHVHCLNDGDIAAHLERWRDRLWNVHIEDMRRGVHEHLMFGNGDLDVPRVIDALGKFHYRGPVHVELSRHSHDAVNIARRAYDYLSPLVRSCAQADGAREGKS